MRIIFVTDNFTPESNAPASRTHDHCREWMRNGVEVTVVTCFPNFPQGKVYDGYQNSLMKSEVIDGIKVVRLWSFIRPNKGFVLRTLDHLSFAISSFIYLLLKKRKSYDALIVTSPQFFVGLTGFFISKIKRKPWFFEVRDLWPEGIIFLKRNSLIYKLLEKIEGCYYHSASGIITVTSSFKKDIIKRFKIPEDKIKVVYNSANNLLFEPTEKSNELVQKLGLQKKFVVGYAGTLGISHGVDFILACTKEIFDFNKKIHFLFVGAGAQFKEVATIIKEQKLQNVTLLPSVEKRRVPEVLSVFDCGLVNLKDFEGYSKVIPSKIFELAAMEKPILLGVRGEAKAILQEYHGGMTYQPENRGEFIESCKMMFKKDLKEYEYGLKRLSQDFDRKIQADKMLKFLRKKVL